MLALVGEIKRYSNQTIIYNQIKTSGAQESVKTIARKEHVVEQVNKEVKVFTEQDHLSKADIATTELYEALKERILGLDENISAQPKKQTIGFKIENQIFCDIVFQNRALKLYLNLKSGDLEDAKKISRDVSMIIPQSLGQVLVLFMFHNHKGFPYFNTGNSFKKFPKVLECGKPVPHAAAFVFVFSSYSS